MEKIKGFLKAAIKQQQNKAKSALTNSKPICSLLYLKELLEFSPSGWLYTEECSTNVLSAALIWLQENGKKTCTTCGGIGHGKQSCNLLSNLGKHKK